ELPVVIRQVDTSQETGPLLLPGDVQEQLHDTDAVVGQVALPVVDLPIASAPYISVLGSVGKLLALEDLGMDPHHQHLLVVRAVEDPDLAASGQATRVTPQEVVVELLRRGSLEAGHR